MPFEIQGRVASGNIGAMVFVGPTRVQGSCYQCVAGDKMLGISGRSTNQFPDANNVSYLHATDGKRVEIVAPGAHGLLLLTSACTADDYLKAGSDGGGVPTAVTGDWVGAQAIEPGAAGAYIKVLALQPYKY